MDIQTRGLNEDCRVAYEGYAYTASNRLVGNMVGWRFELFRPIFLFRQEFPADPQSLAYGVYFGVFSVMEHSSIKMI